MEKNVDFTEQRQNMVTHLQRMGIDDHAVITALLKVPRDLFVSKELSALSYRDQALPIACAQTISQPYIVAFMTQSAELKPQDKVLEIGTGSGYQTAILGEICKEVFTIEIIKELGEHSMSLLSTLGYKNIHSKIGSGYRGWKEAAPFDAIVITAASKTIPLTLIEQLQTGGKMILPLERPNGAQHLVKIIKTDQNNYVQEHLLEVSFVPMVTD